MTGSEIKMLLSQAVNQIEKTGLDFYHDCIRHANQFSTKYVLQQALKKQIVHVESLSGIIDDFANDTIDGEVVERNIPRIIADGLMDEYDLEYLNFVEATTLAISLTERMLKFYERISKTESSDRSYLAFKAIIDAKQKYLQELKREHERLRYSES